MGDNLHSVVKDSISSYEMLFQTLNLHRNSDLCKFAYSASLHKFQDKKHLRPVEQYEIAGLVAFGEKDLLTRSPAIYQ